MKKFIETLARKAGDELLKNFHQKRKFTLKSKHEIVTQADILAEKIILSKIRKKYPGHQILSEEAGLKKTKSDYLWIVDPLDGTTNFSFGNPLFSTCIALAYQSKVILGVIYVPYMKEMYSAELGRGATLNNKRIKVSTENDIKQSFITFCHGSKQKYVKEILKIYSHLKLNYFDTRQLGSAGVELGFLAAGRTDIYLSPGSKSWDVAAGTLIVREAGGKVTDFDGKHWTIASEDILATNSKLHSKILKVLKNAR